eukprot:SAG22_NODE_612_length_8579_cov_3.684906_7_plen_1630_part_00
MPHLLRLLGALMLAAAFAGFGVVSSLEITRYGVSTWGGAAGSATNCLNVHGFFTGNGSGMHGVGSAMIAAGLTWNVSAQKLRTDPATVNGSALPDDWHSYPAVCAPSDKRCNCAMRAAPVLKRWGVGKIAWSLSHPAVIPHKHPEKHPVGIFGEITSGNGRWVLDEAVAFAKALGSSASAVFFDWECSDPTCTVSPKGPAVLLNATQLANWLSWVGQLRAELRRVVAPGYELWMYSEQGHYVDDVSYQLLAQQCDRIYNANFYRDDLTDYIKPQYANRTDLKPLPLDEWEEFAGVQLAETGLDVSKFGAFYLEFRGKCNEYMCNASVYDHVPLIEAAGGFEPWLTSRIAAMCRAGVQWLAFFASTDPAYERAVAAAEASGCSSMKTCSANSSRPCNQRNHSICNQDTCCTWDADQGSGSGGVCHAQCTLVKDPQSCQSSPRCAWAAGKCGYECGLITTSVQLFTDDEASSAARMQAPFWCHWAIVVGADEATAEKALDQLDSDVRDRFAFDHILLGQPWKQSEGYHFPGKAQGGLSGLFLDGCPYSNLDNASYTHWESNYNQCMNSHISTLPQLFENHAIVYNKKGPIPMNWTGLVVWDLESWKPSWQDSTWSLDVVHWEWLVANISSPVFEPAFLKRVGFVPPPATAGWGNLSRAQQTRLLSVSYEHFARDYFERTILASKTLRPMAQWGLFSYPFVALNGTQHPSNYPPFGYRGEPSTATWQSRNDKLGWLWSMLDVFLPQLYPAGYVTAHGDGDNPCGEAYSQADNERFINTNVAEMHRLRNKFGATTRTPIIPFWWQHMCDGETKNCRNNMSVWASDLDIQQHFELTSKVTDGMIIWGDPYWYGQVHKNDDGAQTNKTMVDLQQRYASLVEQYCTQLKTDDAPEPASRANTWKGPGQCGCVVQNSTVFESSANESLPAVAKAIMNAAGARVKTDDGLALTAHALILAMAAGCVARAGDAAAATQLPPPHTLRVEYLAAPIGVEVGRSPRFSWRLAHPAGRSHNISQTAYALEVCRQTFAADGAGAGGPCHTTGRVVSALSVNVQVPGLALVEGALYIWRVQWWGSGSAGGGAADVPSAFSRNATFGTELQQGWAGSEFIGGNYSSNQLRAEFVLNSTRPVGRAVLYIIGLGNSRSWLSGHSASDVFRSPPTQFAKRLLYDAHDVTGILRSHGPGARHALAVTLGHARYASQASPRQPKDCTGGQVTCDLAARVVLAIEFEGGKTQRVVSRAGQSSGWFVTAGPTIHDDSYTGEVFDASLATPGWDLPGFDTHGEPGRWRPAETVATPPGAVLSSYLMPAVKPVEVYTATKFWQPQHNEASFGFGQNVAGVLELKIPEGCARGTRISVTHGEAVHQPQRENAGPGRVFHLYDCGAHGNGCTAFMMYICSGQESAADGTDIWMPRFFTSGGQFVKVEGYPGPLAREAVRLHGVRVDVEHTGMLMTSNDLLNEVSRIGRGAFLGNLAFGFPSDCPTREKRGWLDSGHGAAPWAMMNFDVASTYTVFLRTIRDAQELHGAGSGNMPDYAPAFGNGLTASYMPADLADPGWAAAYCLLVEYIYTFYADDRIWEDHYQHVKQYIGFVVSTALDGKFAVAVEFVMHGHLPTVCIPIACVLVQNFCVQFCVDT